MSEVLQFPLFDVPIRLLCSPTSTVSLFNCTSSFRVVTDNVLSNGKEHDSLYAKRKLTDAAAGAADAC